MKGSDEEEKLVSIIVLNYNGKHLLDDCIASIRKQDYQEIEIIVADNASDDGSVESLERQFPEVRVISHPRNYGFSLGNNIAAEQAKGEYLFFLNNDTRLDERCVSALMDAVKRDDVDICGCSVQDFDGEKPPLIMGCDFLGFPFPGEFFYVEGCAIFFRRDSFLELGGFAEDYFMFFEDLDICWRARLLGKRIIYAEDAIVYHKGGATLFGGRPDSRGYATNQQRRFLGERNNMRTLLKNYQLATLLFVLPIYVLVNILEVIALVILRDPKAAYCYLKAYRDNITSFGEILLERRKIQSRRQTGDLEIMRHMSFFPNKLKMLLKVGLPEVR